ncbi:hypothetical protein KP003_18560 [Geomonas nitrogeniifigens]|uniref:DUF6448 family protein n=1 Tax=Geomonas diazotrophica TaxID=2843197 RepID=UPI001C2C202F|nr:DUF6448 family protein [Geomonas nitrogeniifigens]QXE86334.1 hypothetical protein KP003_18560 [Geomonas nitrogeniifigens]
MSIANLKSAFWAVTAAAVLYLAAPHSASAHCDTLDGPVIQDARKAIAAKDVTPVLKWVKTKDEKVVRAAFKKVISARPEAKEAAEHKFFGTLVKVHRAGEGAPFTGLKPAGSVEPAIAEADKALAGGSPDALVKLVTDDVAAGIRTRYQRAAAAYQHKDESVAQGREFVEAYVDYTHYVERLHQDAAGHAGHGEPGGHAPEKHGKKVRHDGHHEEHGQK